MVLSPKTTVVGADGKKEVKREEPEKGENVDIGNESSEATVKVRSSKITVVDDGEREVKREEPEEGGDVDIGKENSEQPSDVAVNETPTSGNKRRRRGYAAAAQLMQPPDVTVNETPNSGNTKRRRSYAAAAQLMQSSDRKLSPKFGKKSAAQLEILLAAFQLDPSTPSVKSVRCADLCASTGLDAKTIFKWFWDEKWKTAKTEKKQMSAQTAADVPPPTMKSKGMPDVEKGEEKAKLKMDGNKTNTPKISAQQISAETPAVVPPTTTGRRKRKRMSEVEKDEEEDVVKVDENKTKKPKVSAQKDKNEDSADVVPLDVKMVPPAVVIACRDRENSDKGKPKQCALCLEDTPNDSISSVAEAAQFDARFGSNLATLLKYCDCVMICEHHLTDFYALMKVPRPEPVTTVSPRTTKCTICGGERLASVSIVSLKEAASLDKYHGSRVFDALHFSFAVKVCRVHREDLDQNQKAINNQQL